MRRRHFLAGSAALTLAAPATGHVIEDNGKTWKITLRDNLRFHDGQKVLARDAVASLNRWVKRDVFAISDTTLQFRLKRPAASPTCSANPTPAIIPESLALTAPRQQATEIIRTGPLYILHAERIPGSFAVYGAEETDPLNSNVTKAYDFWPWSTSRTKSPIHWDFSPEINHGGIPMDRQCRHRRLLHTRELAKPNHQPEPRDLTARTGR